MYCCLYIFLQISELRKYYANVPGVCDLAEKCLQVRYFVQLVYILAQGYMYKCNIFTPQINVAAWAAY